MNGDAILAALDLPSDSRVDQRVSKKLLLENGAPTAADKRHINEGVEELFWVAALKPTTVGVPVYRDDTREYLEIAVLRLTVRASAKAARLVELVHRAVPYPVLLVTDLGGQLELSAAHKRWSEGEAGKTVFDGDIVRLEWDPEVDVAFRGPFVEALGMTRQPRASLLTLYSGWIDTLRALLAARRTGRFAADVTVAESQSRRDALQACTQLEAEIARLRHAAVKETQMARRVDLNLELKRVEAALTAARAKL